MENYERFHHSEDAAKNCNLKELFKLHKDVPQFATGTFRWVKAEAGHSPDFMKTGHPFISVPPSTLSSLASAGKAMIGLV